MNDTHTKETSSGQPSAPSADTQPDLPGSVPNFNTNKQIEQKTPAELNPASPDFDVKKYREMLSGLDIDSIENRLKRAVEIANDAAETASAEITQSGIIPKALGEKVFESLQKIIEMAKWAKEAAQSMLTPELRRLFDLRSTLDGFDWKTFIENVQAGEERIKTLEPFLSAELPEIRKQPGYEETTLDDIEDYIGLDGKTIVDKYSGQPTPAFIREAIERATAAAFKNDSAIATARRADIIEMPLDKVNSTIWSMLQEINSDGQLKMWYLKAEKTGSDKELNIMYAIDFSDLEAAGVKITKRLMPYDKRVYIAISALFNAGNNVISITQIYYAMGNTGKPSAYQIQKIQDSITKMSGARVFVDNAQELTAYKYNHFKYDGPLLPIERATAIINGQIAAAAIHIFREPPVMTFAKQRKQITTITVKALQSPMSKTDANLLIDDYLLERIGRARRTGKNNKILYSTLYEKAQITTKNQRARAPEKIETYLKHYKSCGLISNYAMLQDGIQIEFSPGPAGKE